MNYNKIIVCLFVSFFCLVVQHVKAQILSINGDTIFVNTGAEIQLIFPTLPTNFATVPVKTQYRIWDSNTGINLTALSEDYQPVTLYVTEAQRNHRFILMFKKNINKNEAKLFYDYSTEGKLAQHIKETAFSQAVQPAGKKNKKGAGFGEPVDSNTSYNALLQQGDRDIMLENYESARVNFDKAHALRPNDILPLKRLEVVAIKLADKQKSAEQETDKKYQLLTEEAKNKIDQKKYTEARSIYNMALLVKPGDVYVTQQLQTLSNLLAEENGKTKKQKITDLNKENIAAPKQISDKELTAQNNYDSAVKLADNFFNGGDYENAKAQYNRASSFSKKDWPKNQINKINKIVNDLVAQQKAEQKKLEQQRATDKRNLELTQLAEQKKTEQQQATDKKNLELQQIAEQKKIELQQTEDRKKLEQQQAALKLKIKTDSIASLADAKKKYNVATALGKASYLKNDLSNAKAFYEEAMNLQPTQQLPKTQLEIINAKLEDSIREATSNEDYDRAIAWADSFVNVKAFDAAIMSYKQASLLKPLESYPWKQIKYVQSEMVQIEKRKKEDKEKQYADALTRADKAVTNKNFDDAKSAYAEALAIHPENEYAKRRFDIISYQLEKIRIEKQSQDSVKEILPIKKSKRKRS